MSLYVEIQAGNNCKKIYQQKAVCSRNIDIDVYARWKDCY